MSLYSLDHEKHFLSAVIRSEGKLLAECHQINENDFSPHSNRPIFRSIKDCLSKNGVVNRYVLISNLEASSIKVGGVIEPSLYINSLVDLNNVNDKAAIEIAKELRRWTIRRRLNEASKDMAKMTDNEQGKSPIDLIAEVTGRFNDEINLIGGSDNDPKDLYGTIEDFLKKKSSYDERSVKSPFPLFNDFYGFFDPGNLSVIVSRMKIGKSTFWLSMLQQLAAMDKDDNLRFLVLDTELTTEENQARALAAASGVKEFYIRHKLYRKDAIQLKKVEDAAKMLKPLAGRISHEYCGGMDLETQLVIARRWAHQNLIEGKRGMIILDYFKLNSSADFKTDKLFMTIGEKVDAFKNLSKELNVHIFCFAQANRENEDSKYGNKVHNSSVIGGSDMIAQFASNIYLLEQYSGEEKIKICGDETFKFTHALKEIVTRQLGPDIGGHRRTVKYQDDHSKDRYCSNFLLFNFNNFHVQEIGTFQDAVDRSKVFANIQPPAPALPPDQKML